MDSLPTFDFCVSVSVCVCVEGGGEGGRGDWAASPSTF